MRLNLLLHPRRFAAAVGALLARLLMLLLALLVRRLAIAFIVLMPSAVVLGECGRSRHGRQENRKDEFTHDCHFLTFPATTSAPWQMSRG